MSVVNIPTSARLVKDVDEEIFLLYTRLASLASADGTEPFRGLGFLDSHQDVLTVRLELDAPSVALGPELGIPVKGRSKRTKTVKKPLKAMSDVMEIELVQDKTALHSRKGDTGSVLWQASVDFARMILQQHRSPHVPSLLDYEALARISVLELGAGTGLLALALGHLTSHYVATDMPDLVPLIRKNILLNHDLIVQNRKSIKSASSGSVTPNVSAEPLDWLLIHDTPVSSRHKLNLPPLGVALNADVIDDDDDDRGTGLILVVDCIYHPSLIPPLLSTLDHLATCQRLHTPLSSSYLAQAPDAGDAGAGAGAPGEGRADVLVVAELRSEDVIREFLEGWRSLEGWIIWSLNTGDEDVLDDDGSSGGLASFSFSARYGVWLGRKTQSISAGYLN